MKKIFTLLTLLMTFCSVSVFAAWTEMDRGTDDSTITVSTCITNVRRIIDDPNSSNGTVRYSSATIRGLIDTANKIFCINSRALTSWATQQLTADTTEYALPTNCLYLERVTVDVDALGYAEKAIPQKTVWQLDQQSSQWHVSTSSQIPNSYYIRNRYLGVYPVPNNTGSVIKIWYIKYPAVLDDDTDYVFDGYTQLEPYFEALVSYAAYHLLYAEGQMDLAGQCSQIWTNMLQLAIQSIHQNPNWSRNSEISPGFPRLNENR